MEADPRSIHVLVMAADEIISTYAKAAGKQLALDIDSAIRVDARKEWFRAKKRAYNYFKHADQDALVEYDGPNSEQLSELNDIGILQAWLNLAALDVSIAPASQWISKAVAMFHPQIMDWEKMPAGTKEMAAEAAKGMKPDPLRHAVLATAFRDSKKLANDVEVSPRRCNYVASAPSRPDSLRFHA